MINLKSDELAVVQQILTKYLSGEEVRVFGSRITDKTCPSSDLDLAIYSQAKLPYALLAKIEEEFSDSPLHFSVDVVDINRVSPNFRRIIDSCCEVLAY